MLISGILNVTPDSFTDGGRFSSVDAAVAEAAHMISQGADIVDIGGESTRPGSEAVADEEEIKRCARTASLLDLFAVFSHSLRL